ncbi:MAG: peptidase M48 Ste24p [Rhodospirillaceae bacterium]|nr:MAG: peptidase M48 Ste24p [Rhodospirillaceae bacterium]
MRSCCLMGHIVVMEGLIRVVEEPDDLAGVLAHEMAHIAHCHVLRQMVRKLGPHLIVRIATSTGISSEIGQLIVCPSHNRNDEREADAGAVEILSAAGLRSDRLGPFLDPIHARALPESVAWLTTHYATLERTQALAELAAEALPGGAAFSAAAERRAVRGMYQSDTDKPMQ